LAFGGGDPSHAVAGEAGVSTNSGAVGRKMKRREEFLAIAFDVATST